MEYTPADSEQDEPTTRIEMSDGTTQTVVTGFGGLTMAVQGGHIIRHDAAGNVIPDEASGVQHPAPGVAVYGENVAVAIYPEAQNNEQ